MDDLVLDELKILLSSTSSDINSWQEYHRRGHKTADSISHLSRLHAIERKLKDEIESRRHPRA